MARRSCRPRRPADRAAPAFRLLVCVASTVACGGDAPEAPPPVQEPGDASAVSVIDAVGRTLVFHTPPHRVLSLVPSATEALVALGASDRLVGRTDFDTAAVLTRLPSVGGGLDPTLEAIVSLDPDLVIHFAAETDVRTPARLDELGIRHLAVRPERIADVRSMLSDLGRITHRTSQADSILASIDAILARVRQAVQGRPPPAVAFLLDGTPPWAAGPGTFIDELIATAGGHNVFDDLSRPYAPVSPEELVARPVDVVLTPVGARPGGLPPGARVVEVPPSSQLPGPRLGQAALEIARVLHPGALR